MAVVETGYIYDEKSISYEIKENGYEIYLDGRGFLIQLEPNIPYPKLGYEGSCLKQIKNMISDQKPVNDLEPRVTKLEETINTILGTEETA